MSPTTIQIEPNASFTNDGLNITMYFGSSDCASFNVTIPWKDLLNFELDQFSLPNGNIIVNEGYDGAKEILNRIEIMRNLADDLEDLLRKRKIEIINTFGEGDNKTITLQQYIRGQY
jgi:hypothetical protein